MKYLYFLLQLPDDNRKLFLNYGNTQKSGGVDVGEYKVRAFGIAHGDAEQEVLEEIYVKHNLRPPASGRSMSVSDTVVLFRDETEEGKIFFCDSIGFKEI